MSFLGAPRRFARREDGSVTIEAILVLPMLAWALLATFSFFDGLRQSNIAAKAAHTVADMLSRETEAVGLDYMTGIERMLAFLSPTGTPPRMRVSVVGWNAATQAFELQWSHASLGSLPIDALRLPELEMHLPQTAGGDHLIVVETATQYSAPFVFGLGDTEFRNVVVTRPRFAPKLGWLAEIPLAGL
ncbi:TadE/TadG family type IV pilus assembly protein [Profundibacterium mesophilum]|uniref:Pilus assembly protein n=1 Tax=Profundibacterium mesophilum KAUST100406-0324 TaxID=1037889 RepID=A0A921NR63_9RHOB|nr:hypothetical protein [Profundibacterium mesophilum]KAF0677032.1 hypothetical protein PMES_00829 [Profundibacterium mesophilum KAUST100406-0324]